jgi:hypothetical protein
VGEALGFMPEKMSGEEYREPPGEAGREEKELGEDGVGDPERGDAHKEDASNSLSSLSLPVSEFVVVVNALPGVSAANGKSSSGKERAPALSPLETLVVAVGAVVVVVTGGRVVSLPVAVVVVANAGVAAAAAAAAGGSGDFNRAYHFGDVGCGKGD